MKSISSLSDSELLQKLSNLNSNEVEFVSKVLEHLIEVDRRSLYLTRGYSSLFSYCVESLNYCEGTAGRRVTAARSIKMFPELLVLFKQQKITLTTISLISKIITQENKKEIIKAVCNKNRGDVEIFVASFLPAKTIRESVRPLPSLVSEKVSRTYLNSVNLSIKDTPNLKNETVQSPTRFDINSAGGAKSEVVDVDFEIKLKANGSTVKKLKRIQELRGKKESLGELFNHLLDVYLEKKAPENRILRREKRFKQAKEKLKQSNIKQKIKTQTRYIPIKIRDKIYQKYGGRCAYISPEGKRCSCRKFLQIDHIQPFGIGGTNERKNLRLLCSTHNQHMAERVYGRETIDRFKNRKIIGGG